MVGLLMVLGIRFFQFHWMDSRRVTLRIPGSRSSSFNSIEWILTVIALYRTQQDYNTFNSIEWIPGLVGGLRRGCGARYVFQFHWMDSLSDVGELSGRNSTVLSIPLNGFLAYHFANSAWPHTFFQFHWMDSEFKRIRRAMKALRTFNSIEWILAQIVIACETARDCSTFNSIEWIRPLGHLYLSTSTQPFNSIEWILHHRVPCSLWKVLSFPLRGFYSIEPPGGGSMCMV